MRLPVLGPMENADLIGLELTRNLHGLLFPDLSDTKTASPLLDAAIARGDTGLAAGPASGAGRPRTPKPCGGAWPRTCIASVKTTA